MKKIGFLFGAVLTLLCFSLERADARVKILYGNGPEFQQMYNLPDSLFSPDGNTLELGITFEQFSLFYVPIWNYGETEWAVYDREAKTIYTLDEETLAEFQEDYGWDLSEKPALSFWNKIGGKLILLVVLAVIGWFAFNKWKESREEDKEE